MVSPRGESLRQSIVNHPINGLRNSFLLDSEGEWYIDSERGWYIHFG